MEGEGGCGLAKRTVGGTSNGTVSRWRNMYFFGDGGKGVVSNTENRFVEACTVSVRCVAYNQSPNWNILTRR